MSAMIIIKATCNAETFCDFAMFLCKNIIVQARDFQRIDIVCDQYLHNSLKEGTRKGHGHVTRKIFDDEAKFSQKMPEDFLKYSKDKESLNRYTVRNCQI